MVSINKIPDLRFFAKAKIIVAGDILLDRYFKGKVNTLCHIANMSTTSTITMIQKSK